MPHAGQGVLDAVPVYKGYALIARTACPMFPLSQAAVPAALPIPLLHGLCTRNTVYSVFKVQEKS